MTEWLAPSSIESWRIPPHSWDRTRPRAGSLLPRTRKVRLADSAPAPGQSVVGVSGQYPLFASEHHLDGSRQPGVVLQIVHIPTFPAGDPRTENHGWTEARCWTCGQFAFGSLKHPSRNSIQHAGFSIRVHTGHPLQSFCQWQAIFRKRPATTRRRDGGHAGTGLNVPCSNVSIR